MRERSKPMSLALKAGTADSSAEIKSSSTMPYFRFSSSRTDSFTRSLPSSSSRGRLPTRMFRLSAGMASPRGFLDCSTPRWGSRSSMVNRGSPSPLPMDTRTTWPFFRATTPWSSRGMVTHWYLRRPP